MKLSTRLSRRTGEGATPRVQEKAFWFALIGGSGTVITFVILTFLHKGLGWGIALSNIPAYSAGIVNNYTWNRLWTYRHQENGSVVQQGMAFTAISVVGLVINTLLLAGLEHGGAPYLVAFALATVLTFVWNFTANHNLTFRHRAAERLHALEEAALHLPHPHHGQPRPAPVPTESEAGRSRAD
jgi:putative flippase GtrA